MNSSFERLVGEPVSLSLTRDGGLLTFRCQTLNLQMSQGFKPQSHLQPDEEPLVCL